ncbi:coiled-coil domain-containing protein 17 isoform X2 [Dermochelys coriacea]|uniref:coiled-coil domain-containing protein 17 isoform X2 n=1 Tax=Dermochelys coriacea TaxID=27794 RepID=UPI001CA96292|nr:coiled-coil domain-containing protein 17 isoform X2 [Dermochelys coriacea]
MTDVRIFCCPSCDMGFHSKHLLDKHVEKFCIGKQAPGGSSSLNARHQEQHGLLGRKVPQNTETPDHTRRPLSDARVRRVHLGQQQQDFLSDRERNLLGGYELKGSPLENQALGKLAEEFHKLRMSLEDTVPTLQPLKPEEDASRQISRQQGYRERLQEIAKAHEHQVADIQARNQHLEQQGEEIRRRLSELAISNSSTTYIEQLLLELKAQEGKNQLALDALRDQIGLMQAAASRSRLEPDSRTNTAKAAGKAGGKVSISLIPFPPAAGPLSSEIRTLQLAYLQGGGSNPAVLAQMYDLQVEATALERAAGRQEHKERKKKHRGLDPELLAVELENQRLEDELFKLKMQKDKRRAGDGALEKELAEQLWAHTMETAQLHAEIGMLRRGAERMQPRRAGRRSPPMLPPPVAPPLPLPGLRELPFMEQMGPQTHLSRHLLDLPDALGPAPYDPAAGFVIFYDFLLGLDPTFFQICLVAGLYNNGQEMGKPTPLPVTYCQMGQSPPYVVDGQRGNCAILSAKQPVPRVRPSTSIALVMELQASGGFDAYGQEIQRLASRGWAKINLFDQLHQLISGRWKILVRLLPVRPGLTTEQLNGIPQAGKTELYLRVVNARDADMQSMAEIDPGNATMYQYPPTVSSHTAPPAGSLPTQRPFHPAPTSLYLSAPPYTGFVDPPPIQEQPLQHKTSQRHGGAALRGGKLMEAQERRTQPQQGEPRNDDAGKRLGFIIDRVKGAPQGDGVLRLTGYHQKTGQVISTRNSGMTCYTTPVRSNIKLGYFIFGEQEVTFLDLLPKEDMILIVRFYHWPSGGVATTPWDQGSGRQQLLLGTDEWLSAWAVLRLTKPAGSDVARKGALGAVTWNTGPHDLTLYHGPVPPAHALSVLPEERQHQGFQPYGSASGRLYVFSDKKPDQPFPPESPVTLSQLRDWPWAAFIHHTRETPALEPFIATDGFDLYIDGARFLPDAVTITRVTGRIFDSSYNQIGPDISTGLDLSSNIFEPLYNYNVQIRDPAVPPSAALLLKLYSLDRFSFKLVLIGWAALNLFVESGTHRAPGADSQGIQVSLNEGAHQLRVYHSGPDTDQPFSVGTLTSAGRYVPCASLLVRLLKAPVDSSHQILQRSLIPQADWVRLSLFQPRPDYSDGVYYSDSVVPTTGERCLYSTMGNRSAVLVREIAPQLAGNEGLELNTNEEISAWIKETLTRTMDSSPQPFNLTYVSRYLPTYGIKFAMDGAKNLPWSGLTVAHFCFNPPGAFYFGRPWLKYDRPVFVEELDLDSYQQWPVWLDGFKSFPQRIYNEYLTVIIHLHEVLVNSEPDTLGKKTAPRPMQRGIMRKEGERLCYALGSEAWTALQVFSSGYCNTDVYQLPLYQGAPSQNMVTSLSQGPCASVMQGLANTKVIQLVRGASVVVRIADGRRDEELSLPHKQGINQSYLPMEGIEFYKKEPGGAKVTDLMPRKAETQQEAQLLILDQI